MEMAPRQNDPQYKLRMTPEIKGALDAACRASGRSLNAEILHRLERTLFEDTKEGLAYDLLRSRALAHDTVHRILTDVKEQADLLAAIEGRLEISESVLDDWAERRRKDRFLEPSEYEAPDYDPNALSYRARSEHSPSPSKSKRRIDPED